MFTTSDRKHQHSHLILVEELRELFQVFLRDESYQTLCEIAAASANN